MDVTAFDAEVDRNFDAFEAALPSLLSSHRGEFALIRQGKVLSFHGTESEALAMGRDQFEDGLFSIQEITDRPVDLGFFSHAVNPRLA